MPAPTLYFDLGSPYAYLSVERAERALGVRPRLHPTLLGPIFALRVSTQEAIDRGVRGAPTLDVHGVLLYGDDRLEEAITAASASPDASPAASG